jgi:inorganic phosphate transporter, PiT family
MTVAVVLVVLLVCASVFVNGWTDSPNAIATVISTRVLPPRVAIVLGATFNFLGVFLMGSAVARTTASVVTLGSGEEALISLAAAQVSIVVWAVGAWRFGIPTSESHALIAGLMGAGMSLNGFAAFQWASLAKVAYGLAISTFVGFLGGFLFTFAIRMICTVIQPNARKANTFFSFGQMGSAAMMAFSHGAQDGQKFMGVLYLALIMGKVYADPGSAVWTIPVWIMVLCSVIMAVGTSVGGYRIIKTMGMEMVRLEKYQGFGAELAASGSMIVATVYGIPLSTTNTKATAMMGAGAVKGFNRVNWGVAREMVVAWVLTFPACLVLGYVSAVAFRAIAAWI